MRSQTKFNYRQRLTAVIDYIYQHIDQDLDVNTLADIACMSPYHFHRVYRALTHETVNMTVRRLRLHKSAAKLIRSDTAIKHIASMAGYKSLEAFSRAFSQLFGESPSQYRARQQTKQHNFEPFVASFPFKVEVSSVMYTVIKEEFPGIELFGMPHKGDYQDIGSTFTKVFMHAKTHDLIKGQEKSFGIYYDDPKTVAQEELRSAACMSLDVVVESQKMDLQRYIIPAGRCVSLLFKGPYSELEKPYEYLFGVWLPEQGLQIADFPAFEEYLNDPMSTPPSELLTKIYCLLA